MSSQPDEHNTSEPQSDSQTGEPTEQSDSPGRADGLQGLRDRRTRRASSRASHLPPPHRSKPSGSAPEAPAQPEPAAHADSTPRGAKLLWIPLDQLADKPGNRPNDDLANDP